MNTIRDERVRQRAYELWEADGSPEGRADEYWQRAVAQIDAEGNTSEGGDDAGLPEEKGPAADPEPDDGEVARKVGE